MNLEEKINLAVSSTSSPTLDGRPPRRQWILVQKTGKSAYWLDEEIVTSIGTDGCDILVQSPTVDPQHAVVWFDPDSSYFYLKDLDTGSGTFLNGKKMSSSISTKLRNMDLIRFGFDSNLYQIRLEAIDGSSPDSRGAFESRNQDEMDLRLHSTNELPPPKSSRILECDDSGNCSSSSPSSPVKPCTFPSVPVTKPYSAGIPSSPQSGSEELFSNKYSPMAFTVDFGPTETKALGITDSISKYAPPRHRRTMSQPKAEGRAGSEGGESGTSRKSKSGHTHSTNSESDSTKRKVEQKITGKQSIPPVQGVSGGVTAKAYDLRADNLRLRASEERSKSKPVTMVDNDDRRSEAGTYTVELDGTEETIKEAERFGREDDVESPTDSSLEWVREWAERASKEIEQNPSPSRAYESEVSFAASRLEKLDKKKGSNALRNSWHEERYEDIETYRMRQRSTLSPNTSTTRLARETSAVSDYSAYVTSGQIQRHQQLRPTASHSPALSRKKHAGVEQSSIQNSSEQLNLGASNVPTNSTKSHIPSPSPFSRNDGGRFSLRAGNRSKSTTPTPAAPVTSPTPLKKGSALPRSIQPRSVATVAPSAKPSAIESQAKRAPEKLKGPHKSLLSSSKRANSTLTAKEVELANWNRRKSYDPMKAAALGKKKEKKMQESDIMDEPGQRINPDGAASISKSPSFHNSITYPLGSSTEELGSEEDIDEPPPPQFTGSLTRMGSMSMQRCHHDDSHHIKSTTTNIPRPKHKFEALDCLVISTIHSLSNKVRTSSRRLLEKIQIAPNDDENGALVDEMISQLKELEISSPHKGPSRELSGTLKNLKKLEQVILVLDRILCCESDDM